MTVFARPFPEEAVDLRSIPSSEVRAAKAGWLRRFVLIVLGTLGILIALDWWAISEDFEDADGWVDCWPGCTFVQEVAGIIFVWGQLTFLVLVVLAIVLSAVRRGKPPSKPY